MAAWNRKRRKKKPHSPFCARKTLRPARTRAMLLLMATLRETISGMCKVSGIRLNTDLGQHFLCDQSVLDAVIAAAKLTPGQRVVEIGAGMGILTKELLKTGANVTSIELDRKWLPILRVYLGADLEQEKRFTLIHGNALDVDFPEEPYTVVANIPYQITSPLLRHAFLESKTAPTNMTLLIQREVAERICNDKEGNLLGLMVSFFGKASIVRHVPGSSFFPPPKVESSVLHIETFPNPLAEGQTLERVLMLSKLAFGQKRKMLSNTIGSLPEGDKILTSTGIDPKRRPQTLTTAEWIALAQAS